MIRQACMADVPRILEIYAPYILETAITFEYTVPSLEDFRERFNRITQRFPWIVWEENGKVLGYAYGSPAMERAAYGWDADLSIYLDRDVRGCGIGSRLYGCLEELLVRQGFHNLYGLVTGDNLASCRFHEKRGYELQGVLKQTGWKMGQWHDVHWYAKRFCPAEDPGNAPSAFCADGQAIETMRRYSQMESDK